jgi:hypothetical protein
LCSLLSLRAKRESSRREGMVLTCIVFLAKLIFFSDLHWKMDLGSLS